MSMNKKKVLLGSSSKSIRGALSNVLAIRLGMKKILEAGSAIDTLNSVRSEKPDIVIYDTGMHDIPLSRFISESGIGKTGDTALILITKGKGAPLQCASPDNSAVRCLTKPFSSDALISLIRDLDKPLEYRKTIRVHPQEAVSVDIKCGDEVTSGTISDISLGGLSCSTTIMKGLNVYSAAALTLIWDEMEPGVQRTERCTVQAEAVRIQALPPSGKDDKRCIIAFRSVETPGHDRSYLERKISHLLETSSKEIK